MPQLIYLAIAGEYDDTVVLAGFTHRPDAVALEGSDFVAEVYLYDGPAKVWDWHQVIWYKGRKLETRAEAGPGRLPNPYTASVTRRLVEGSPADEVRVSTHGRNLVGIEPVWVEGWDLELVQAKVAELIAEEAK